MRPLPAASIPAPRPDDAVLPAEEADTAGFGLALLLAVLGQTPPTAIPGVPPPETAATGTMGERGGAPEGVPGTVGSAVTGAAGTPAATIGIASLRELQAANGTVRAEPPSAPVEGLDGAPVPDATTDHAAAAPRPNASGAIRIAGQHVPSIPQGEGARSESASRPPVTISAAAGVTGGTAGPAAVPRAPTKARPSLEAVVTESRPADGSVPMTDAAGVAKGSAVPTEPAAIRTEGATTTADVGSPQPRRAADQVTLRFAGEDGVEATLRVSARGAALRATIVATDPAMATRLEHGLSELQRALTDRGFANARVSVQHPAPAVEVTTAASPRPEHHGAGEDTSDERHPHPGDPRNPDHAHSRRRAPRQNPER